MTVRPFTASRFEIVPSEAPRQRIIRDRLGLMLIAGAVILAHEHAQAHGKANPPTEEEIACAS